MPLLQARKSVLIQGLSYCTVLFLSPGFLSSSYTTVPHAHIQAVIGLHVELNSAPRILELSPPVHPSGRYTHRLWAPAAVRNAPTLGGPGGSLSIRFRVNVGKMSA